GREVALMRELVRISTRTAGLVWLFFYSLMVATGYTDCVAPPAGIVAWWQAEGSFMDSAGTNYGASAGDVAFLCRGGGGQGFKFERTSTSYIEVPDSASLHLTNELTIEFWVKRLDLPDPPNSWADYIVEKGGDLTGGQVNYSVALHNASANYCLHFVFAGGWR